MGFARTSLTKSTFSILLLCTFILATLCHNASGQFESIVGKAKYTSKAIIRIAPRQPAMMGISDERVVPNAEELFSTRHDLIMTSDLMVRKCFEANDLFQLSSFEELSRDDTVKNVIDNLKVELNPDDPTIVALEYRSTHPSDAKVVLSNLILTYERWLEKEAEAEHFYRIERLKDTSMPLQNSRQAINTKIKAIKEASPQNPLTEIQSELAMERLQTKQSSLSQKYRLKKLVADCLTNRTDDQACQNMIWNLVEWGEINERNLENKNPIEVLEKSINKIEIEIGWIQSEIEDDSKAVEVLMAENIKQQASANQIENLEEELAHLTDLLQVTSRLLMDIDPDGSDLRAHPFQFRLLQEATLGEKG